MSIGFLKATAGGSEGLTMGLIGLITPELTVVMAWSTPGFTLTGVEFTWIGLLIGNDVALCSTGVGFAEALVTNATAPIAATAARLKMWERFNMTVSPQSSL